MREEHQLCAKEFLLYGILITLNYIFNRYPFLFLRLKQEVLVKYWRQLASSIVPVIAQLPLQPQMQWKS